MKLNSAKIIRRRQYLSQQYTLLQFFDVTQNDKQFACTTNNSERFKLAKNYNNYELLIYITCKCNDWLKIGKILLIRVTNPTKNLAGRFFKENTFIQTFFSTFLEHSCIKFFLGFIHQAVLRIRQNNNKNRFAWYLLIVIISLLWSNVLLKLSQVPMPDKTFIGIPFWMGKC